MDLGFDGVLHWCCLIALFAFVVGLLWVSIRVLIPLRRLAKQAEIIMNGSLATSSPTFDKPVGGIREIEQLQRSLRCMVDQIQAAREIETAYRKALTESQENERMHLAREIHDDTIQSLVLVSHSIERAAQAQKNEDYPDKLQASGYLDSARSQLIDTIDNLRQVIANLRPTILDELGLATAIEVLCENRPTLAFSVIGDVYGIDHTRELAIFRAVQEITRNAECHAHAKQIKIELIYSADTVALEVRDDGVGFQVPQHLQEFAVRGHYGLLGIQERVRHLGGKVNMISKPAVGTCITVMIPTVANPFAAAFAAPVLN
jgi:signal transduction histidine kinase